MSATLGVTSVCSAAGGSVVLAWGCRSCFGEESMVVGAVVAVLGRSILSSDAATLDVGGSLPVSSKFLIRNFRSSSSSQTVSAVCESSEAESGMDGLGSELSAGDSSWESCSLLLGKVASLRGCLCSAATPNDDRRPLHSGD